jgi:hypothetical protein
MAAAQHSPPRAPLPAGPVPSPSRAEPRGPGEGASRRACPEPSRRAVLAAALAAPLLPAALANPAAAAAAAASQDRSGASWPVTFKDRAESALAPPPQPAPHPDRGTTSIGSPWNRALAAWRRADAAIEAASGTQDQAHYDRLGARHDRALVRLLTTPAPDATALADKLDLAIAHQISELTAGETCLASLLGDARRLAAASS